MTTAATAPAIAAPTDRYLSIGDLERAWTATVPTSIAAYVNGGAGEDAAVRANRAALDAISLCPRGLFETAPAPGHHPDMAVNIFGTVLSPPVILAPTSPQRLVHADAELAVARGAAAAGAHTIVSCDSHHDLHRIVSATESPPWAQVFPYHSRNSTKALLDYCRSAGATTAVITIDASHRADRLSARRANYELPSFVDYGTLRATGILHGHAPRQGWIPKIPLTFEDMNWLRDATSMTLLAKGVTRAADAVRLVQMGYEGIIVSNHGGRQLDGAVPAIDALAPVVDSVGSRVPVLFDSGVRSGQDVLRAMALGAAAVCVGRPYLWGLGVAGPAGVQLAIELIHEQIRDGLLQLGLGQINELDRSFIHPARDS